MYAKKAAPRNEPVIRRPVKLSEPYICPINPSRMGLNIVWFAFFAIAFCVALFKLLVFGDTMIFKTLGDGIFDSAKTAVTEVAFPLAGTMIFFLGLLNIGEKAGLVRVISRWISPLFRRLFPEVPKDHRANGEMVMNFSANLLGLDNAATPFGLKAMESLQELNPDKEKASNAQIMFLVLHTSGLTLIPMSAMAYRISMHAIQPASIFIPCIVTTVASTITSILVMVLVQKLRLDWILAAWLGALVILVGGLLWYVWDLTPGQLNVFSNISGNLLLVLLILGFLSAGLYKKVPLFEVFIEGAKDGWNVVVRIFPYLVGMLVGVRVFKDCGALDGVVNGITWLVHQTGLNSDFTPALPVALMRPFNGQASRALMLNVMQQYKPDSFAGNLSSIMQNSAETTFYIIAVYFGAVNIRNVRYAVWAGILADILGVIAAIFVAYIFFHHNTPG